MPLPRLRRKGEGFLPFFLWLAKQKSRGMAGPWRALWWSLAVHGAVLALPSSHHAAHVQARAVPASLEVRLPREAAPTAVVAGAAPEAAAEEVKSEEESAPVERGGMVSAGHYFDSAEVDVKAEPIELAPLVYPEEAYVQRLSGVVTVRVYISDTGAIDAVDIVSAEPPDIFETAALDALLKTRFKPAQLFGRPVASVKRVAINFDPRQDAPPP